MWGGGERAYNRKFTVNLRVIIQLCSLDLEFICTSVFFNWLTRELTRKSCDYLCKQHNFCFIYLLSLHN